MNQEMIDTITEMWLSSECTVDDIIYTTGIKEWALRKIVKELHLGKKARKPIIRYNLDKITNFIELWNDPNITISDIQDLTEKVFNKRLHEDTLRKHANKLNLPSRDVIRSHDTVLNNLPIYEKNKINKMIADISITLSEIQHYIKEKTGIEINKSKISQYFGPKQAKNTKMTNIISDQEFINLWNNKDIKIDDIKCVYREDNSRDSNNNRLVCERTILARAEKLNLPKRYYNPNSYKERGVTKVKENEKFIKNAWLNKNITIHEISNELKFSSPGSLYRYTKYLNLGKKITNSGTSQPERELTKFIENFGVQVVNNDRKVLQGKEIDILVPDNFGVEFNGLMWHSIGSSKHSQFNKLDTKDLRNLHLYKTQKAEAQGIQLFHIFENEWSDLAKRSIWKSVIANKLHQNKKIGARKTEIRYVSSLDAKKFEQENHLQGPGISKIKIGLYHLNTLVSLMTFSKGRGSISAKYEWELVRFCSKKGVNVQGGASKLFKYFTRTYKPSSIVSFANRRWSQGNLYTKLGFTESHVSPPNYFYFNNNKNKLYSRNKFQKHKLKGLLEVFDESKTEWQNMNINGYRKIYDSGNYVFTWSSTL